MNNLWLFIENLIVLIFSANTTIPIVLLQNLYVAIIGQKYYDNVFCQPVPTFMRCFDEISKIWRFISLSQYYFKS